MNSPMAQTLSKNQTLHGCDFLAIFAKIWLPWQRPLDPCNQKCTRTQGTKGRYHESMTRNFGSKIAIYAFLREITCLTGIIRGRPI